MYAHTVHASIQTCRAHVANQAVARNDAGHEHTHTHTHTVTHTYIHLTHITHIHKSHILTHIEAALTGSGSRDSTRGVERE